MQLQLRVYLLSVAPGETLGIISFNSALNRYEVITPFTENDIKILAVPADPNASLDKVELRNSSP